MGECAGGHGKVRWGGVIVPWGERAWCSRGLEIIKFSRALARYLPILEFSSSAQKRKKNPFWLDMAHSMHEANNTIEPWNGQDNNPVIKWVISFCWANTAIRKYRRYIQCPNGIINIRVFETGNMLIADSPSTLQNCSSGPPPPCPKDPEHKPL